MKDKKIIYNNLQKYRVYNGYTQTELANKIRMRVSQLRLVEKQVKHPNRYQIDLILDLFNVTYNQMFYEV